MENDYVLGIDIGTGSTKGVAMDSLGKVLAEGNFFYSINTPQPRYEEQDIEEVWQAFVKCIKEITKKLNYAPINISLSSAMHSLILVDRNNEALTPSIIWADSRSSEIAQQIKSSAGAEKLYAETGMPIHSMSPLCKIVWFRKNKPGIFKNASRFISVKEFIWFRIFGTYEIDESIASATGLFNINTRQWNSASLELAGITDQRLSKLVPTSFVRKGINPKLSKELHLPETISFCIGASDGCLANLGTYAIKSGIVALTIGTSGAVRMACKKPIIDFKSMMFNYVLDENTFISGGPINNGGIVAKWLLKTFLKKEHPTAKDYDDLFKNIDSVPAGSEGLIFLPYLLGERAPLWDENLHASYFGIKSHHTTAHFLRAGIEGVCFALNSILEIIEAKSGQVKQLSISGGFTQSNTWMQILADITGKKLYLAQTQDASTSGAILMGMKAIHLIKKYDSFKPEKVRIIQPQKTNIGIYKANFEIYKKQVEKEVAGF